MTADFQPDVPISMNRRPAIRALACLQLLLLGLVLGLPIQERRPAIEVRKSYSAPVEPGGLHLQWVRFFPPLTPAWPDQLRLQFDAVHRPVALGSNRIAVASSRTDSVAALDAETGEEIWRFQANGPVRLAPAVWQGRVYFTSDDGHLYCVAADDGRLLWKFRGGPADRLILGNDRLISSWPARAGPVVADGIVYFAAGIWPFMGIFLHALDASTGEVIWTNDGDGAVWTTQPHHADSFAGIAPQGQLVIAGNRLLVPGRSVPACYDRTTGQQLYWHLARNGHRGGADVQANGQIFVNDGAAFSLATGESLGTFEGLPLLSDDALWCCTGNECIAYCCKSILGDGRANPYRWGSAWTVLRKFPLPAQPATALARDGLRLFVGTAGQVHALDISDSTNPEICWHTPINGTPAHLLAANGRLVVSTREGRMYCFGPGQGEHRKHRPPTAYPPPADEWTNKARRIVQTTGIGAGWCIAWGAGSGRLVTELACHSELRIVVIEPDEEKAAVLRQQLTAQRLHADRVAVVVGRWDAIELPPYLASLMVAEKLPAEQAVNPQFVRTVFHSLRPYGGVACLPVRDDQRVVFDPLPKKLNLAGAEVRSSGVDPGCVFLVRAGALPGAGNWTHEHADSANTRVGSDELVKAPLGLLWFGGPSHQGTLPRHGHGPQPQVIDGRLIIEGPDRLRAMDIYTGRLLWEALIPNVGKAYDESWHQPGANATGTNFISMSDGIYVAVGSSCLRLDPATGKQISCFTLPLPPGETDPCSWSYINVCQDYLVAGANGASRDFRDRYSPVSASKHLFVMNRHTGRLLWKATSRYGYRNNAICMGGGRLYAIDRPSSSHYSMEGTASGIARLAAYDLPTGRIIWTSDAGIFGTSLAYSAKEDVLIEAGRPARDTLYDEADGMRAWHAGRGTVMWHRPDLSGPAMIHDKMILADRTACDLLTGAIIQRRHPLTGKLADWNWSRDYGCNLPLASKYLLTFRSGAAGYFDLAGDGGTGNIGGFRSGCTNNLIVAGGVLVAPDYTRTCTCSYQNQTSVALVPMPAAEMWTWYGTQQTTGPVRQVGINFGAPGNRRAPDGTLWLEVPRIGGPSYQLPVTLTPNNPPCFRRHPTWVKDGEARWVAASGVRGITGVIVDLAPVPAPGLFSTPTTSNEPVPPERSYTVRLYFIEPDGLGPGDRRFDVAIQGRPVLTDFDIADEAGGIVRTVVKEFRQIRVVRELTITLAPGRGRTTGEPILCGIEVRADGW